AGVAAAAFVGIFFLGVPFPLIILAAGLLGYVATRNGSALFQGKGGHGPTGKKSVEPERPSLLGEETPAHARRTLRQTLTVAG
ncbi:chromate transporter, partial [Acinetobacter baumannii]